MINVMIPFRKTIGFRLFVISFILLAIPLLVDSIIVVYQRHEQSIVNAKEYLIEITDIKGIPLTQIQPVDQPLLDAMSYFLKLQSHFPEQSSEELDKKLLEMEKIGNFSGVSLLAIKDNDQYIVTASTQPEEKGKNYTEFFRINKLFSTYAQGKDFASYIFYSIKTLETYFVVAHLIIRSEKDHKPVGVLVVTANVTNQLEQLLSKEAYQYNAHFALLLPSTVVVAATDPELDFQYFLPLSPEYRHIFIEDMHLHPFIPLQPKYHKRYIQEASSATRKLPSKPISVNNKIGYPFFEFEWKGMKQIGYIKRLPGRNFAVLAYVARDEIFHTPLYNFFSIYGIYALILIVGGIIAYLLTRRMAKPIQSLSSVMQSIQRGDVELRYQKDRLGFEINVLGNVFNEMVDRLLEHKKVAEEERVARETFARELRLGQQVERSLFPEKMPTYPHAEVAEVYIPASEVGGDFYDVFVKGDQNKPGKLILVIADTSGKGVRACFYSMGVRNMLRTFVDRYEDIGEVISATNNLFLHDTGDSGMFVTAFMGLYDDETRLFRYYSAGHNPAIVRRADGNISLLSHHGIALGVVETKGQHAEMIQLEKGDAVIFYTDGVTEAHDEQFVSYGEQRLMELIKEEGWKSASELAESIVTDVNNFAGAAPQHDDITLLVMKTL